MTDPSFAAFISHASMDRRVAGRVEAALGRTRVWLDRSDIRLGALLGRELLANIRRSRTLVLVWSAAAARSPWVQVEWLAAVNLGLPVIPVAVDSTPLPQALANTLRHSLRPSARGALLDVVRAVRTSRRARRSASVAAAMRLPDATRDAAVDAVARAQEEMFQVWSRAGLAAARRAQRHLEPRTLALLARYPSDPRAAVLWAYHAKNGVLLDHDAEIAAGIRVTDHRLDEARWRFLRALWLDPRNADALNGLGTIAWFDHDLDTAEFFVRAALRSEPAYAAARHDLQLILDLRRHGRRRDRQTGTGPARQGERAVPVLRADDLLAARTFYVDGLGFAVTVDTSDGGTRGMLGLRRGNLELTVDSPMKGHGRRGCVALHVADADALYRAWRRRVKVLRRPRTEAWGARTFDLVDPAGNTLVVIGGA